MEAGELMEIYNEKMERMETPDLTAGWLEEQVRTVYHAAVEAVGEIWHHEVIAEYPNGGRDVCRVIDRPGIEARDAWEEKVEIWIYHPYTAEELADREQRPTIEDRLIKLEEKMALLNGRMETALDRWKELTAREGVQ